MKFSVLSNTVAAVFRYMLTCNCAARHHYAEIRYTIKTKYTTTRTNTHAYIVTESNNCIYAQPIIIISMTTSDSHTRLGI